MFLPLIEYSGDLPKLIREHSSVQARTANSIDAEPAPRLYILDGYDEVPANHFDDIVREVNSLLQTEPNSRVLLTSRQALFVSHQTPFAQPFEVFCVLDYSDDDVDCAIRNAGVDRAAFRSAAAFSHLSEELGNPLALDTLLKLFKASGTLGQKRSDSIQHVVDAALESRPTSNPAAQKRALRMLAIAMEVAARNDLAEEEAVAVLQRALRIDIPQAKALLAELAQSVLVRTTKGYRFQLHSYGEYLAAEELSEIQDTDRILRLIYLEDTYRPSDSWRNCVSYLMEHHDGIRSVFSRKFPDWTLTASPSVFDESDRTTIVCELLTSLVRDNLYLLRHPTIRVFHLARFVTDEVLPTLRTAVESTNDVEAANAVLLLAASGDKSMADRVLALGLDETRSVAVQHSALAAYGEIGTPAAVDRLLDIRDWDGLTVLSRIDAAAALMDSTNAPAVLGALCRTDAMISSAFVRFDELSAPADVEAVLHAVATLPGDLLQRNPLSYYLDRFWRALARCWRVEWIGRVTELILRFEEVRHPDDRDLEREFIPCMQSLRDGGNAIGRSVLEQLLVTGRNVRHLYHTIPALVGVEDARWLAAQPGSEDLVNTVRAFGRGETAEVLRGPTTEGQREHGERWQAERRRQEERTQRLEGTIRTSEEVDDLVVALERLDPARWPEVGEHRRRWLAGFVGSQLARLDLRSRIRWESETQLTQPRRLAVLLALVSRYELALGDDEPLALALLSETQAARSYHRRFGFSRGAVEVVEELLEGASTPNPGLDHILSFIGDVRLRTQRIDAAIECIAMDGERPTRLRDAAVHIIADVGNTDALLRVAPTLPTDLRAKVDDLLVAGQHRGTIERRLQGLLDDPAALESGEVERHFDNPLGWIGRIREPAVWGGLVKVRRLALLRGLERVASLVESALAEIDMGRAAEVVAQQLDDAPGDWRPWLRRRAAEMRRDGTIRSAQAAGWMGVLRRLGDATTLNRFKIWVEGPTDCPALQELVEKVVGGEEANIMVQSVGGWTTILNSQWTPVRLGDGCRDFVMLLDGDGAYDYERPGLVMRPERRRVVTRLREAGIDVSVLERYGLENYFGRHAFEAVVGRDLSASFPLGARKPVKGQIRGYSKTMNVQLARLTTADDLRETDLGDFLVRVGERVRA